MKLLSLGVQPILKLLYQDLIIFCHLNQRVIEFNLRIRPKVVRGLRDAFHAGRQLRLLHRGSTLEMDRLIELIFAQLE